MLSQLHGEGGKLRPLEGEFHIYPALAAARTVLVMGQVGFKMVNSDSVALLHLQVSPAEWEERPFDFVLQQNRTCTDSTLPQRTPDTCFGVPV